MVAWGKTVAGLTAVVTVPVVHSTVLVIEGCRKVSISSVNLAHTNPGVSSNFFLCWVVLVYFAANIHFY